MTDVFQNDETASVRSVDESTENPSPSFLALLCAEQDLLRPQVREQIQRNRPGILPAHIDAIIDVKLEEAKKKLPLRWEAESLFEGEANHAKMIIQQLSDYIDELQDMDKNDAEAEIIVRTANSSIAEWEMSHSSQLESYFAQAKSSWVFLTEDPLPPQMAAIKEKIAKFKAVPGI